MNAFGYETHPGLFDDVPPGSGVCQTAAPSRAPPQYEKGQNAPTLELLLILKAHSGRSIDWIVTGEEVGGEK